LAIMRSYGGIAGHYLLISDGILKKHHARNQCIGTGYGGGPQKLDKVLSYMSDS
jgi:hypothetical protein